MFTGLPIVPHFAHYSDLGATAATEGSRACLAGGASVIGVGPQPLPKPTNP